MAWREVAVNAVEAALENSKDAATSAAPSPRAHHSLTWIPERATAVVIGGSQDRKLLADVHLLERDGEGAWRWRELRVKLSGSRNALTPRARHSAVAIHDSVYVFGGIGGGNAVFALGLRAERWIRLKSTGRAPCARFAHAAVAVEDDMFVIGGHSGQAFVDDVFRYQTRARRWSQLSIALPNRPPPSLHYTACTVADSEILVFGGAPSAPLDHVYVLRYPSGRGGPESFRQGSSSQPLASSFTRLVDGATARQGVGIPYAGHMYRWAKLPLEADHGEYPRVGYDAAAMSCSSSMMRPALDTGRQRIVYFAGVCVVPPRPSMRQTLERNLKAVQISEGANTLWTLDVPISGTGARAVVWEKRRSAFGECPPPRFGTRCIAVNRDPGRPAILLFGGAFARPRPRPLEGPQSGLTLHQQVSNRTHLCELAAGAQCRTLSVGAKAPLARSGHSFTWIGPDSSSPANECALVLGGDANDAPEAAFWDAHLLVYDQQSRSWNWEFPPIDLATGALAPEQQPRHRASQSVITGGCAAAAQAQTSSESDAAAEPWQKVVPPPISAHTASLYASPLRKLFVFGGGDLRLSTDALWVLHMNRDVWSWERASPRVPAQPSTDDPPLRQLRWPGARAGHAACLHHGILYIMGGACSTSAPESKPETVLLHDVWALDVDARLANARPGKRGLFQDLEWTLCEERNNVDPVVFSPRFGHSCVSVPELDSLVVFGGCAAAETPAQPLVLMNDLLSFEPEHRTWRRLNTLTSGGTPPSPRYLHTCTVVSDEGPRSQARSRLCVVGGFGLGTTGSPRPLNDVFVYNTFLRTWSEVSLAGNPLPALWRHAACRFMSKPTEIFIFGGMRGDASAASSTKAKPEPVLFCIDTQMRPFALGPTASAPC